MTEQDIIGLIDPRSFYNAWFRELPNHKTYQEAYEAIEEIYESKFKKRKYSCYKSFEVVARRITKSKNSR